MRIKSGIRLLLLGRSIIISYVFVDCRDLRHLLIGERKIKDIEIIPDMLLVGSRGSR